MDGPRVDNGGVGAGYAWKTSEGWTTKNSHLGSNKGMFGAKVCAIYQAPGCLGRRQEIEHQYTISVDSTAAIDRIRSGDMGPGQQFAVASMEICT